MSVASDSRKKLHELLDLIRDVDERRYGPEYGVTTPQDVADGQTYWWRCLSPYLQT